MALTKLNSDASAALVIHLAAADLQECLAAGDSSSDKYANAVARLRQYYGKTTDAAARERAERLLRDVEFADDLDF